MRSFTAAFFYVFNFIVNPPPIEVMTYRQRITRVFLITSALVILSINGAIVAATFFYVLQWGRKVFVDNPQLEVGLFILILSLVINVLSVCALLHVRRADRLIPPK